MQRRWDLKPEGLGQGPRSTVLETAGLGSLWVSTALPGVTSRRLLLVLALTQPEGRSEHKGWDHLTDDHQGWPLAFPQARVVL